MKTLVMGWVMAGVFGIAVLIGLYNGFLYALDAVKRFYRVKKEQYRQRHHLPGDKVHRPRRS